MRVLAANWAAKTALGLAQGLEAFATAWVDAVRMKSAGLPVLPHQEAAQLEPKQPKPSVRMKAAIQAMNLWPERIDNRADERAAGASKIARCSG